MSVLFFALLVAQPQGELIWGRSDSVGGICKKDLSC
jgi:hypothetical protein